MNQTTLIDAVILNVALERGAPEPLFEQLVQTLRQIILTGRLKPGSKLPSTRKLAGELSVSRATIVTAYEQLKAEGYIHGRKGAGMFVVEGFPDDVLQAGKPVQQPKFHQPKSQWPQLREMAPFQPTSPDMRLFPHKEWASLFQRVWSNPEPALLANADPLGWWPLRYEITEHLRLWRGIECQPQQVVITSGASETMQTIAHSLFIQGDHVAREEPGYRLLEQVLLRAGISVTGVAVDNHGLVVEELQKLEPTPNCVITTPSRQYPLGMTMPLTRRLLLLQWAQANGQFIIEDDYDSEYRYAGQPLPALMSLAQNGSVVYMGSFSKVFSKTLRIGYFVVPENVLPDIRTTLISNGSDAALLAQPVLAWFMANGSYASHMRKMRRIYAGRQKTFLDAAKQHLDGLIEFSSADGGMHLVGKISEGLAEKMNDVEICQLAATAEIALFPVSKCCNGALVHQGIIAGYAGFSDMQLVEAAKRLATVLRA